MLVHLVPDDVMPPGAPCEDEPFDDAWYRGAVRGWETDDESAGPGSEPPWVLFRFLYGAR
jgi:hypothetical protein